MKNIQYRVILFALILNASSTLADNHLNNTLKFREGGQNNNCVYGEASCGIAWEGKGLFTIEADAYFSIFNKTWEEDLDLQQAYLCCNNDDRRQAQCKNPLTTARHCSSWVDRFYTNPLWMNRMRELPDTVQPSQAGYDSARMMKICIENTDDTREHVFTRLIDGVLDTLKVFSVVSSFEGMGALIFSEKELSEWAEYAAEKKLHEIVDNELEGIENGFEGEPPSPEAEEFWNNTSASAVKSRLKYLMRVKYGFPPAALEAVDYQFDDQWVKIHDEYELIGKSQNYPDGNLKAESIRSIHKKINRIGDEGRKAYNKLLVDSAEDALTKGRTSIPLHYYTDPPSTGCVEAIFDTLRDATSCLWNNPDGDFCSDDK